MSETINLENEPKTHRLIWRYSAFHRKLAQSALAIITVETAWLAFSGFELKDVKPLSTGNAGFAPLTSCKGGSACASKMIHLPPPFITTIDHLLIYLIPIVCVLALIAPSVAREFESKAIRTTWTQSITRKQWLSTRLISGIIVSGVVTGICVIEMNRWYFPHEYSSHYYWQYFQITNYLAVALSVLMVTVAIYTALYFKKQALTMLISAGIFVFILIGIGTTFQTLLTPKSVIEREASYPPIPKLSLVISSFPVTKTGAKVSERYLENASNHCNQIATSSQSTSTQSASGFSPRAFENCMTSADIYEQISYQPPYRFSELEAIYTIATLAVAGIVSAFAFKKITKIEP